MLVISLNSEGNLLSYITPYLSWGIYFLTGSFVFFIKNKIILDYKILIAFFIFWIFTKNIETLHIISELICFSYFTLCMSFKTPVVFPHFFKQNDFSYSMYLYAYPLQQIIILQNPDITPWTLVLFTSMAIIPFCWLSWNFVEKPALKLKSLKI